MGTIIKQHKILATGLHCVINDKGRVEVYTEKEYAKIEALTSWWEKMKRKYFNRG
jgi:hypothetical protein